MIALRPMRSPGHHLYDSYSRIVFLNIYPTTRSSAPKVWQGFVQGAAGSMAGASVSHPLDLLKVRLQIDGK